MLSMDIATRFKELSPLLSGVLPYTRWAPARRGHTPGTARRCGYSDTIAPFWRGRCDFFWAIFGPFLGPILWTVLGER
jgi:hypothetical protein